MFLQKARMSWSSYRDRHPWSRPILVVLSPWLLLALVFGVYVLIFYLFLNKQYRSSDAVSRGNDAYRRRDFRAAERSFRHAIETAPDDWSFNPSIQSEWGASLIKCGRADEVSRAVNTPAGRELLPEDWNVLGVASLAMGATADAVKWFEKASRSKPQMPLYHHNWAVALQRAGDIKGAARERTFAIRKGGPRYMRMKEPVAVYSDFPPL